MLAVMGDAVVIIGLVVVAAIIAMRRRGSESPARWSSPRGQGPGPKGGARRRRLGVSDIAVRLVWALMAIFVIIPLALWLFD